ncbi:MAG: hypothetical protein D6814_13380 [Calditrichaeota bacterium]|nr:MAG: hypothetical protein D6814_13380 [Calditrichota bacterium]
MRKYKINASWPGAGGLSAAYVRQNFATLPGFLAIKNKSLDKITPPRFANGGTCWKEIMAAKLLKIRTSTVSSQK